MYVAMTTLVVLFCLVLGSWGYDYPFQDPSLPWESRVDDLVSRLSLEEMTAQTTTRYTGRPPQVKRLGVKPYIWITECLHGQRMTDATAFPQALGLAATFSRDIIYDIAKAISYEVRGHWNNNIKHNVYKTNYGLNCFSPLINLMRHPLWGRNQETYGEDPYLIGQLSVPFVQGLQGNHPRYTRVVGGCKHLDAYAGPDNYPIPRHKFDAKVPMRDLRMSFLPAFKTCIIQGKTINTMCSYNAVNGVPSCVNKFLLHDVLHQEWNFTGFVISDAGAVEDIIKNHKYLNNATTTVAQAVKAGCNMEVSHGYSVFDSLYNATKMGLLTETEVRESVKKIFMPRFQLGEFDPPEMNPFNMIDVDVIQSQAHRDIALKAAQMSLVLLKNENNLLPLKKKIGTLAITGPFADDLNIIYGSYRANIMSKYARTPYQALKDSLSGVTRLGPACSQPKCTDYNSTQVKEAVSGADLTIVCLGLSDKLEGEEKDRRDIYLPGQQLDLLKDSVRYADGKPVLLLMFNGGPLDITWAKMTQGVTAIIECFYPAQATGQALYNILTMSGENSVPAGRLPNTWPAYLDQVPPITEYNMDGQTYRYYHGEPLYPFGYGLSYSTFEYISLDLEQSQVQAGQDLTAVVTLVNTGPYDADEVVQLYLSWSNLASPTVPKHTLVAFERPHLIVDEPISIKFVVTAEQMAVWNDKSAAFKIYPGDMMLYAGGQQPMQRTTVPSNVLSAKFTIK